MLHGLPPLTDLTDYDRYENAWWHAIAEDHDALDSAVLDELAAQK